MPRPGPRRKNFSVRLSEEQIARIDALAGGAGLDPPDAARLLLDSGWKYCCGQGRTTALEEVAAVAKELLAEIDNQPVAPEQDGTIGRLRAALDDLSELADATS